MLTLKQYIAQVTRKTKDLADGEFIYPCVSAHHARTVERVFVAGKGSDGKKYGDYSNRKTGIYINPLTGSPVKFTARGKTGRTIFTSGKRAGQKHKTGWFPNYKAYRRQIGRVTAFVNLRNTEQLKIAYTNALVIKKKSVQAILSGSILNKFEGAVAKYGEGVFMPTRNEYNIVNNCIGEKVVKKITGLK